MLRIVTKSDALPKREGGTLRVISSRFKILDFAVCITPPRDRQIFIEIKETIMANFNVTPNAIDVFKASLGSILTEDQLKAIIESKLRVVNGCITSLNYHKNSDDLQQITLNTFSDGIIIFTKDCNAVSTSEDKKYELIKILNLGDFHKRLQEAANFGHRVCVVFCEDKIISLNILPHKCLLEEKEPILAFARGATSPPPPNGGGSHSGSGGSGGSGG